MKIDLVIVSAISQQVSSPPVTGVTPPVESPFFDSVVSQVIATIITAGILYVVKRLYDKYKKSNDYSRLIIAFLIVLVAGLNCFYQALKATELYFIILLFAIAIVNFAVMIFLFVSVTRTLSKLDSFIDSIADDDSGKSEKEKSK